MGTSKLTRNKCVACSHSVNVSEKWRRKDFTCAFYSFLFYFISFYYVGQLNRAFNVYWIVTSAVAHQTRSSWCWNRMEWWIKKEWRRMTWKWEWGVAYIWNSTVEILCALRLYILPAHIQYNHMRALSANCYGYCVVTVAHIPSIRICLELKCGTRTHLYISLAVYIEQIGNQMDRER